MSEEMELPKGWVWATLDELTVLSQNGCSKRRSDEGSPTIVLRLSDLNKAKISLADVREIKLSVEEIKSYELLQNDLVCIRVNGTRSIVGRMIMFKSLHDNPIVFCDHFIRFRLVYSELAIFVSLYFETERSRRHIESKMVSTAGQNTVSQGTITSIEIPLAPLPEQHRIVAAIEQQFTRLDAGIAALKRAKTKLKRYRAAVLKAAVEGKLTDTWRAEHPTTEPASLLLERILDERRAKWEADLRAKGKDPAKVKYVEPTKPDEENLPELPEGWCWVTVEQLSDENRAITYGVVKLGDPTPCISLFIGSPPIQTWMMRSTKGIAYTGINIETLKEVVIPLPPLAEQEQIVAEAERRLSIISELEATVEANLKRAERLRQSILREAFAGRLVPQDPTDEPASILLERICNERKNGHNASIKTGSGRRVLRAPEPVTLDVTETEQAALWESVER